MIIKENFDELSDGNKEYAIGQWQKGKPCYKVGKDFNYVNVLVFCGR